MEHTFHVDKLGQIVILNGTPRSGKSSIAHVIQNTFDGIWMNMGVDCYKKMLPERCQPGIGMRPGGERPDLEPLIVILYRAMFESIAVHSRLGLNVVVDAGLHDAYSKPLGILKRCARQLEDLPVLFVGVRCPIEVIIERRRATWHTGHTDDGSVPEPIMRWQKAVHDPGIYDIDVDTSVLSPEQCADLIQKRLLYGPPPTAFHRIADMK